MGQYGPFAEDLSDTTKQAVAAAAANPTTNFGPFAGDIGSDEGDGVVGKLEQALGKRVDEAKAEFGRQPDESTLHMLGRDYLDIQRQVGQHALDIGEGLAKPFVTLGEAFLNNAPGATPGAERIPFTDKTIPNPSLGDVALAAPQALATIFAGPAEGALAERMGGGLAARVGARAVVGGGVGALFDPGHPGVGAAVGALGGVTVGGLVGHSGTAPAAVSDATVASDAGVSLETMVQNFRENLPKFAGKGGFSFDPRTGEFLDNGNFVGLGNQPGVFAHADENPLTEFDGDAAEAILRNNADLFTKDSNVILGGEQTERGLNLEPSRNYDSPDEAFMAAVEGKQRAFGSVINGDYTEVPTASPEALEVYNLAKQFGKNPSETAGDFRAQGQPNAVAETLAQLARRTSSAAAIGAAISQANGIPSTGGAGVLQGPDGVEGPPGNGGAGNVPPGGGAPEAPGPEEAPRQLGPGTPPRAESGDAQTGPGSPDGQRAFDERIPESQLDVDDFINIAKTAPSDPDGADILVSLTRRTIQNHGLNPKQVVTHAETVAQAHELGMDPDALKGIEGNMTRPQLIASRFAMRRLSLALSGLGQRYRALKQSGLDGQAEEIFGHMVNLVDQFDGIAKRFIVGRSEAGRTLDALKIAANQTTDPTVWMIRAKQKLGEQPLTPEIQSKIETYAGRAADAPMGSFQRRQNLALLAKYTDSLGPADKWYNAGSAYRAGLLSSPSSFIGAAAGHTTWAIWHGGELNMIAALDQIMGKITGVNTLGFNPLADARARAGSFGSGVAKVKSLIKYGVTGDEVGKVTDMSRDFRLTTPAERFEIHDILHESGDVGLTIAGKRVAETYVNMVRRVYGVVPTVLREQANAAALAARARGIAISENLGGELADARVKELLANPTPDMLEFAHEQAESAALTARTALGDLLNRVTGKIEQYPGGKLATAIFAPFKTVPSNIATIPLKRMPWMVALGMKDFAKAAIGKGMSQEARRALQLQAADRIVRGGGGAALLGAGMWLAKHRLITPPSSGKPSVNQTNMLLGAQPNAFKMGGSFVSGAKLQPVTTMLGLGALIYNAFRDPQLGDFESRVGQVTKGYATMIADAPFFEGMKNVTNALENPGSSASKFTEDVVKGAVPSIVRHTAQAIDPYQHIITDEGVGKYAQTLESVIPGLSQRLPVAVDQLGHPITRQSGVGAFAPFPAMQDKAATDPVSAAISATGATVPALKQNPGESVADFQQREQLAGTILDKALTQLVASPSYQNVDDAVARLQQDGRVSRDAKPDDVARALQRMMIEKVVARVHSAVNRGYAVKEGLTGPKLLRVFMNNPQDEQ